jgi:hypothetical protein
MPLLTIAPGFHLDGDWPGRLLVDGRAPDEAELRSLVLVMPSSHADHLCLFRLPAHLLEELWMSLEREGGLSQDVASTLFAEVAGFLEYKSLAPPAGAVFEVVARRAGETEDPRLCLDWGVANLGDEATHSEVVVGGSRLRLRLEPGEGYRLPKGGLQAAACTQGQAGPDLRLVIRRPEGAALLPASGGP